MNPLNTLRWLAGLLMEMAMDHRRSTSRAELAAQRAEEALQRIREAEARMDEERSPGPKGGWE